MSPEEKEVVKKAFSIIIDDLFATRQLIEEALELRKKAQYQDKTEEIIDTLVQELSAFLKIPLHMLTTPTRQQPYCYKRQISMVAIWRVTQYPRHLIEAAFGIHGKKHGAIKYCIKKLSAEETIDCEKICKDFITHMHITL